MMPFGLKNAGATYQRMMTRMFKEKIRRMMKVYIDDMVVKIKEDQKHMGDIMEIFEILSDTGCALMLKSVLSV